MPELSIAFMATPEGWAALVTLVAMEVVLGIDNLIFISILTNKLPAEHRARARRLARPAESRASGYPPSVRLRVAPQRGGQPPPQGRKKELPPGLP